MTRKLEYTHHDLRGLPNTFMPDVLRGHYVTVRPNRAYYVRCTVISGDCPHIFIQARQSLFHRLSFCRAMVVIVTIHVWVGLSSYEHGKHTIACPWVTKKAIFISSVFSLNPDASCGLLYLKPLVNELVDVQRASRRFPLSQRLPLAPQRDSALLLTWMH